MHDITQDFRAALYAANFELAERIAIQQIQVGGETCHWRNEQGLLMLAQGNLAGALEAFDRAVQLDPQCVEAIINGAIVLSDLGYYDEAAMRMEAALSADDRHPIRGNPEGTSVRTAIARRHLDIAAIHRQTKHYQAAQQELQTAIDLADLWEAHVEMAKLEIELGRPSRALESLDAARTQQPRNPEIHVLAAQAHLTDNNRNEALTALHRAELLDDRSQTGHALRNALGMAPEG